ncbi:MAG TPA: amidohydrolase family protein, partial [Pyrinomonadaceae bacterium]|nr:amidohydrolase family protein [Pyrinomonadaceae bacterium]
DSNPFVVPGFGLHDELAMLVESGLSPMEALRAATENPAEFLRQTKTLGSLEAGQFADLVLLDANPLEDIHNTTRISAVIVRGRVFDRPALDAMLMAIEAAASKSY